MGRNAKIKAQRRTVKQQEQNFRPYLAEVRQIANSLASMIVVELNKPIRNQAPFHNSNGTVKEAVRRMGARLDEIGGHELMYQVAEMMPRHSQRDIDMAFNGIGEWRA